jgi:hypothetical protein
MNLGGTHPPEKSRPQNGRVILRENIKLKDVTLRLMLPLSRLSIPSRLKQFLIYTTRDFLSKDKQHPVYCP